MNKLQRSRVIDVRPSLMRRAVNAVRAQFFGPFSASSKEASSLFGGRESSAGVTVTEETALEYSAFFGAVNLISSQLATLPLVLHKRIEDGGKERFSLKNPLYKLLHDRPNPEMSSFDWRKVMQAWALTWGKGISEIERDQAGRPVALWPLFPGRVRPYRANPRAPLQYLVTNQTGGNTILDQQDVIHIHGLSIDGIDGLHMVQQMRDSLGLGIATERLGAKLYKNGTLPGGVISYPGDPGDLVKKNNRDALAARHEGVDHAHRILALYGGAQYSSIGISPNLAQFLETRQFQVTEVARWFNIPPHKLGDLTRSTNNNIENQEIDFYNTTMMPWFTAWEQELWYKLVTPSEQNIQFFQFMVQALLRGDAAARGEFYAKQSLAGAITPNEIRESENRNKIPGGDVSLVPLNTIPLNLIGPYYESLIEKNKQPPPPPQQHVPTDPSKEAEIKSLTEQVGLARRTCQEAEDAKDIARSESAASAAALIAEQSARATAEAEVIRVTAQAVSLCADLETAARDVAASKAYGVMVETDYQRVCVEKAIAVSERDAAAARADDLYQQTEALSLDIVSAQDETARANARALAGEQRATVSEAVVAELRGRVDALTATADGHVAASAAAAEQVGRAQAELAQRTLELAAAETRASDAVLDTASVQTAFKSVREELRRVLAYDVGCIVRREADRARKAQASPEKLLKWVEHFYPLHGESCREALRPILRAVAAADGGDVEALLGKIVPALVDESTTQLRLVAQDADAESLAPALERVLRRWEAERGQALADRVLKGGT